MYLSNLSLPPGNSAEIWGIVVVLLNECRAESFCPNKLFICVSVKITSIKVLKPILFLSTEILSDPIGTNGCGLAQCGFETQNCLKGQNLLSKLTLFSQSKKKTSASAETINLLCGLEVPRIGQLPGVMRCQTLFWLRFVAASAYLEDNFLKIKNIFVRKEPKQLNYLKSKKLVVYSASAVVERSRQKTNKICPTKTI